VIDLEILFEDNHLLAVNKPAGLLSQGDRSGEPSQVDVVTHDLKHRYAKPGRVYVGLLHRLDRPASGVMLLAKTSKAATRLSEQFRARTIAKIYWAIVAGSPSAEAGIWSDVLAKDSRTNRSGIRRSDAPVGQVRGPDVPVGQSRKKGDTRHFSRAVDKTASVEFRTLERWKRCSKLELRPLTGRSHQLRVQLGSRGLPILGDIKYGSKQRLNALDGRTRIALHARQITFAHPTHRQAITVVAPLHEDWPELLPGWPAADFGTSIRADGPRG
jgi:23S rRNA pseudouridine1911/1915/1917 synthase